MTKAEGRLGRHLSMPPLRLFIPSAGLLLFALVACSEPVGPSEVPDVRPWVTGEAARHLSSSGQFIFSAPATDWPYEIIDSAMAAELGLALSRTFPSIRRALEEQRGEPINFANLTTVTRLLGQSPYSPLPDSVPRSLRKSVGPKYLVRLLERGAPAISVGVSAFNTDVRLEGGEVILPVHHGGEFQAYGIRRGEGYRNPISPEEAVVVAGRSTGALITEVPELVLPHRTYSFGFARWRLVLDRTVTLQTVETGERHTTRVLFVGLIFGSGGKLIAHNALLLPKAVQPRADTAYRAVSGVERSFIVPLREDVPVYFDQVDTSR